MGITGLHDDGLKCDMDATFIAAILLMVIGGSCFIGSGFILLSKIMPEMQPDLGGMQRFAAGFLKHWKWTAAMTIGMLVFVAGGIIANGHHEPLSGTVEVHVKFEGYLGEINVSTEVGPHRVIDVLLYKAISPKQIKGELIEISAEAGVHYLPSGEGVIMKFLVDANLLIPHESLERILLSPSQITILKENQGP